MSNSRKFFVVFAIIFAMMATVNAQQTFTPDRKGEVNAVTDDVRLLMDEVSKVLAETAESCITADQKLSIA